MAFQNTLNAALHEIHNEPSTHMKKHVPASEVVEAKLAVPVPRGLESPKSANAALPS